MTQSVSPSDGWLVGRSVCYNFLKGNFHFHAPIGALVFFEIPFNFQAQKDLYRLLASVIGSYLKHFSEQLFSNLDYILIFLLDKRRSRICKEIDGPTDTRRRGHMGHREAILQLWTNMNMDKQPSTRLGKSRRDTLKLQVNTGVYLSSWN